MAILSDWTSCWTIILACCAPFALGQSTLEGDKTLAIAAFNIQNLGTKKFQNEDVLKVIVKILSRYDVVLVQEIVDRTEKVIFDVVKELNKQLDDGLKYNVTVGPRVGRTMAKEQYAYIYRKSKLELVKSYSYHDPADAFEREPFVAIFKPTYSGKTLSEFALVGIHTKPTDAVAEIQHLNVVAEYIVKEGTKDIILMGDFNADCDYVRKKHWSSIPLWTSTKYVWLISHEIDTTATASNCAYDRIVVTGDKMDCYVVEGSAFPFRFDKEYKLGNASATAVSDHYPIEVTLNVAVRTRRRSLG